MGSIPCGGLRVGFGVMSTLNLKPQIYDLGVSNLSR
jgi:tRNA A37 threonylcarbamoyladenosine modification protein TsaB